MSTHAHAPEHREPIPVKAAGHDGARPAFLHGSAEMDEGVRDGLVLAVQVVNDFAVAQRVAKISVTTHPFFCAGNGRPGQRSVAVIPRPLQRLVGTVLRPQPLAKMACHGRTGIGFVVNETVVVPFAVNPGGHLNAEERLALRRRGQGPAELAGFRAALIKPALGSQAVTRHSPEVKFHRYQGGEPPAWRIFQRSVRPLHTFFRMRLVPPGR